MNSAYVLTSKQSSEPIIKVNAPSLTEAIILISKIKRLDPNELLSIYKVIEQPNDNGRRKIKGRT
mgnify:FL=1